MKDSFNGTGLAGSALVGMLSEACIGFALPARSRAGAAFFALIVTGNAAALVFLTSPAFMAEVQESFKNKARIVLP